MPADVDRGRLVALVVCGLAWAVAAAVALGGSALVLVLAAAYAVAGSLVLSVQARGTALRATATWAVLGLWWVVTLLRVDGPGSVGTVLLAVVHGVLVGCLSFAAWLAPAFLVLHAVRGTTPR